MTRDEIRSDVPDRVALICTLYGEVRSEPLDAVVAVGQVIRTRVEHPRWWGQGWKGVCTHRWQFSCWWEESSNAKAVFALAEALLQNQPIGEANVVSELSWVADGLIGNLFAPRFIADHYLTERLYRSPKAPEWAKNRPVVARAGAHVFLRLEI